LLDLPHTSRLEELRLARGMSEVSDRFERIDSGVMAKGPGGSWVNCAVGLGFADPSPASNPALTPSALTPASANACVDRLVDYYATDGIEPRIELSPYDDPALARALADRGFVVRVFENILARPLDPGESITTPCPAPPDLRLRAIAPTDAVAIREAATVIVAGFSPPGAAPRAEDIELWERCARHPRTTLIGAYLDGRCVGAGSVEVSGEIAALFGLSIDADYRRRGIQQALIAHRLRMAASAGARVATIGARPRVPTERNVRRMGFQVAYTKVILVRPAPGLTPVFE